MVWYPAMESARGSERPNRKRPTASLQKSASTATPPRTAFATTAHPPGATRPEPNREKGEVWHT